MPVVSVEAVSKTYDRVRYVLENVSLTVDAGEVVVMSGRSGSGKTTILNLVAGLEEPTAGRVLVRDVDLAKLDEEQRTRVRLKQVGIVFQRFHLVPELTVLENVRLPMRLAGRADAKARAHHLLQFFGIDQHANAFPSTLSGGETQRAAIARALGNEPAVVLADEPTANLDDENAKNALAAIRRVADELGTAVLIATHDPLVREIGDRILQLVNGRIDNGSTATPSRGAGGSPTRARET